MKRIYYITLTAIICLVAFVSCSDDGIGETVETANILLPFPDMPYKFTRNGETSVDTYEVKLLDESLQTIERRMQTGSVTASWAYKNVVEIYNEGLSHIKPVEQIATSYSDTERKKVKIDIFSYIENSKNIGKLAASEGVSGNAGEMMSGSESIFVDEKGVCLSETFSTMIDGAIFLDKILNCHLKESLFTDSDLQKKHEQVEIAAGRNYTELEHHWDLAYGYYQNIQAYAQADGIRTLQGKERKIRNAFVSGRLLLGNYQYEKVVEQIRIIRTELSRVIATRAMSLLVGKITWVNFEESPKQAFKYLSQSLGLIYSLQFTCDAEANECFTYQEVENIIKLLLQERGLWDNERLLQNMKTAGSLKNIAQQIGERYDISIEDINKQ